MMREFHQGCFLCVFEGRKVCAEKCFQCSEPEVFRQDWLYSLGLYFPRRSGNGQHYSSPWTQAVVAAKKHCLPVIAAFGRILAWVISRHLFDLNPALVTTVPAYFGNSEGRLFQIPEVCTTGLLLDSLSANLKGSGWQVTPGLLAQIEPKTVAQHCCKTNSQRKRNIQGLYIVPEPGKVKGQSIILIDDILTTAATMAECSKILYESGAISVFGIVLAKTVRKNSVVL